MTAALLARRLAIFSAILIGVDALDELASGIPGVASPDLQREFGVSYGMAAGWTLTAFGLLAVVLEPPLFLLSDRHPRRWFVCGGLAALGLACLLAALAPSYWVVLVALLLFGPASGVGVNLSQATLVDANPEARERMLMRWTLAGSLGDLSTPLLLAALAWIGLGWRAAFATSAVIAFAFAAVLWRQPYPSRSDARELSQRRGGRGDASEPPLRTVLADALRNRQLRPWLIGVLLCSLMDELLVAFGALHLRDAVGVEIHGRALILGCLMAGAVLGLVLAEWLLRRVRPLPLLAALCASTLVLYAAWLSTRSPLASAVLFMGVGISTAGHYPIAQAQAYRALPDRSGTVHAALTLVGIVNLPVPIALGWVADSAGLTICLALLGLQPLGLLAISLGEDRGKPRPDPS